jgi:hypothetical protein
MIRPLPTCSALPPSAPEPPTLTPQPVKEVSNRGQKQGGLGLRVPVRLLSCERKKNCDRSFAGCAGRGGNVRAPSARWARLRRTLRRAQGCVNAFALFPSWMVFTLRL